MSLARFHLLARDDGGSLPFPIGEASTGHQAAPQSVPFAGWHLGLAQVLTLGREEHPYLHPSPTVLCT